MLSRLKPSALEFLKRRGAGKAAAPATLPVAAAHPAAAAAAATPATSAQPRAPAGGDEAAGGAVPAQLQRAARAGHYRGPKSEGTGAAARAGPPPGSKEGQQEASGGGGGGLAGRLRFNMTGEVVGIKPEAGWGSEGAQAEGLSQEVVRRDPMR